MENENYELAGSVMRRDCDEKLGPPVVSRRALVGGAAALGFLTFVPRVPGTNLVPFPNALGPQVAYASEYSKYTFTVVGADQVGFKIVDVSTAQTEDDGGEGDIEGTPVKDATVTLTKRCDPPVDNPPTVSGTTKSDGTVTLSIKDLALDQNPKDGIYVCNCSITVSTAKARVKMRDFSAGLVALEGASGVIIGTHKSDSQDVYLERCTFDDWDVHYSMNTFFRGRHNDIKHTILVHVKGVTADVNVDLTIIDAKDKDEKNPTPIVKKKTAKAKYDAGKGYAVASWSDYYLETGNAACITKDEAILRFSYTVGKSTITEDIRVNVEDIPTEQVTLDGGFIPFSTSAGSLFTFSASNDWPCFNGLSFSVLNPNLPLQLSTSLTAISLGIGTNACMLDDNGKPSLTAWKSDHKGNITARYDRMYAKQMRKYENARKKTDEGQELMPIDEEGGEEGDPVNNTLSQKNKFFGDYDFNVIVRVVLNSEWKGLIDQSEKGRRQWTGGLTGQFGISASGTAGLQSPTTPPFYVTATLGLTFVFAYTAKVSYEQAGHGDPIDVKDYVFDFGNAWGIYIKPSLAISLGVGYKGVFSLSFDSTFAFPVFFGWGQDDSGTMPSPHTTVGVSILLEVVFQCFLFKLSANIYSYSDPNWYNNWENKGTSALTGDDAWGSVPPRFRLTHPDGTYRHTIVYANDGRLLRGSENIFEDMFPVTDDALYGAREADASRSLGANADEIDEAAEAARFVAVEGIEGVFRRDDGTVVFTDKLPRAYEKDDGTIGTELVDCEGVNTFSYGEQAEGLIALVQKAQKALKSQETVLAAAGAGAANDGGKAAPGKQAADAPKATGKAVPAAAAAALGGGALTIGAQSATFAGDPMLGYLLGVQEEYNYKPVPGKTTGAYCGEGGIRGLGANDGVAPNVDVVIFKDVHSDPRQRVVEIGGMPYLFRVSTVSYPVGSSSQCRSRVTASAYDTATCTWGVPKVIEYNTGDKTLPRIDTYDYDFDIVVRSDDDPWYRDAEACLLVVGGLRPADGGANDGFKVYDAFANPVISIVLIDKDLHVVERSVNNVSLFNDDSKHMLCSPCIVDGFAAGGASGALAYTFLHRSASTAKGLLSTDAVSFGVGHCFVRADALSFPKDLKFSDKLSPTSFGIKAVAGDPVKGKYDALLTVLTPRDGGYDVHSAVIGSGKAFNDLAITHNISCNETLPEVQPWPHHGTFLFTKDRPATDNPGQKDFHLYEGTYDINATGQAGFAAKQVDTLGMKGASFCVSPSGNYLFYNESHTSRPPVNDTSEIEAAVGADALIEPSIYRIMGLRYDGKAFSEDFTFCDLDHPIDHIELLNLGSEASSFIITEITDADKNLADMRYVSIPNTQAAKINAFSQVDPFVYAGKTCPFQIDILNCGNMIIGGFDVEMHDPDRGNILVDRAHVETIDPKSICMNAANLGWGHHAADEEVPVPVLTDEEKKGMLMPGKTMSYVVDFDIPSDWRDEKTVSMRIVNLVSPPIQLRTMASAADNDVVHYYHPGTDGAVKLHDGEAETVLYDPVETVTEHGGDPDDPITPNKPESKKSATTPKTGDPFGVLGPLGLAVGGAAALLAGYSARRARIEREQREGEGE